MPSRRDLANAIRVLSMDAVQKANSGHPGAPMGMADIAEVLWNDFLKHNPTAARILFEYEVYNEAEELLTIGETTMVFVDMKTGRPTPAPASIQGIMAPYFANGVSS